MASKNSQMLFMTIFCFLMLWFMLPNYLGVKPNILMLASPFAIYIIFIELEKKASFRFWVFLQVICTSVLLFVPYIIFFLIT